MIVKFQKEYLSELYYEGKCKDKKHRYQPTIVKRYKQVVSKLFISYIHWGTRY